MCGRCGECTWIFATDWSVFCIVDTWSRSFLLCNPGDDYEDDDDHGDDEVDDENDHDEADNVDDHDEDGVEDDDEDDAYLLHCISW